jgi:hypothetical protein
LDIFLHHHHHHHSLIKVLSSGTAAHRSAIHASIGELEGVCCVRDCFPWPVRDDDDQEGDNNDSRERDVDLLKSDLQRPQEDTDQEQEIA